MKNKVKPKVLKKKPSSYLEHLGDYIMEKERLRKPEESFFGFIKEKIKRKFFGKKEPAEEAALESIRVTKTEPRRVDISGKEKEYTKCILESEALLNMMDDLEEAKKEAESEKKNLEAILDNMIDGVTILDMTGKIMTVNRAAVLQHGYKTKKELVGKTPAETFIDKKDIPQFLNRVKGLIKGRAGIAEEYQAKRKDGTQFIASVNASVLKDNKGKPIRIIAVHRDITERKQAEEKLKEERLKLARIFEELPILTYYISVDSKIKDCNKAVLKTLGYKDKKELVGKSLITTIYAPSSRAKAKQLFLQWKKTGKVVNEELQVITKQGKIKDVILNVGTITDAQGKPVHSISTQLDITERKEAKKS